MLTKHNQLYKTFKAIGHEVINSEESVMVIVDDHKKLNVHKADKKLYNKPSPDDFGVIIPADYNNLKYSRDIIIQKRDNFFIRISESHPVVHPASYVLLFPSGELGWSPNMKFPQDLKKAIPKQKESKIYSEAIIKELPDPTPYHLHDDEKLQHKQEVEGYRGLSLLMYIQFFLCIRKNCFNLIFKGIIYS